jgi:hypothetical protein
MQESPQNERRTEQRYDLHDQGDPKAGERQRKDGDHRTLKETVETAASAYFSACRKLARAINRLKQN